MESVITTNPRILGGTPCFSGTRVAVKSLFDILKGATTSITSWRNFPGPGANKWSPYLRAPVNSLTFTDLTLCCRLSAPLERAKPTPQSAELFERKLSDRRNSGRKW